MGRPSDAVPCRVASAGRIELCSLRRQATPACEPAVASWLSSGKDEAEQGNDNDRDEDRTPRGHVATPARGRALFSNALRSTVAHPNTWADATSTNHQEIPTSVDCDSPDARHSVFS